MTKDLDEREEKVIEQCGTEKPFSSDLLDIEEEGVFKCKKCGQVLFDSNF
jgi:peptide-methionine (R)-S-oxide reductase